MRRKDDPLDTYLLRVFCLLINERSVSRVALRLNQSQPAISAALKRLREIMGDPLLVREKGGMVPTERAESLLVHAKSALAEIERMTSGLEEFDPSTSRQSFRIGAPDYLTPAFFTGVTQRFRNEAPHATLTLLSLGPDFDFERALAEGTLDLVIGNWPKPPERMHLSLLLEDDIVCLMSATHPLARKGLSNDDFKRVTHIVPVPYSPNQRGVIDATLATLNISRKERVVVQSFSVAPYLVRGTDLVFTISSHFANFYARLLGLVVVPSPVSFPRMRFYQLWHDRNHHAPGHQWVRRLMTDQGKQLSRGESLQQAVSFTTADS